MAKRFTRIFFATDVHGSERTFRKFINAGKVYKADVIMLCGDLTGKMVIPIVDEGNGTYHCKLLAQDYTLTSSEEVRKVEERVADMGFYAFRTTEPEMEKLGSEQGKSDEIFKQLMIKRLRSWISLAKSHLVDTGIKCVISPGNDDYFEIDDLLNTDSFVINGDGRLVQIDEIHPMLTIGYSNVTPWKCPRDVPEQKLKELIDDVARKVDSMDNCVFNIHVPPIDSGIDAAAKLDSSVYPPRRIIEGGQPVITGVGSVAVREAIQEYQPLLGLHGHIHESRGSVKIGRTVCLNPGSEYGEGVLRGVIVNISDRKILSHQFTSG